MENEPLQVTPSWGNDKWSDPDAGSQRIAESGSDAPTCSPEPFPGELVAHGAAPLTQSLFCPFYRYAGSIEWYGGLPKKKKEDALLDIQWAITSGCDFRIYEIQLPTNPFLANDEMRDRHLEQTQPEKGSVE